MTYQPDVRKAQRAVDRLRDATREGWTLHAHDRDPLVLQIHAVINAYEALIPEPLAGVARIAAERGRQRVEHGFELEHDRDLHPRGELAQAALCYLWVAGMLLQTQARGVPVASQDLMLPVARDPDFLLPWPFERASWKPSHTIERNLEKAGALIAAELDRLSGYAPPPAREAEGAESDDAR